MKAKKLDEILKGKESPLSAIGAGYASIFIGYEYVRNHFPNTIVETLEGFFREHDYDEMFDAGRMSGKMPFNPEEYYVVDMSKLSDDDEEGELYDALYDMVTDTVKFKMKDGDVKIKISYDHSKNVGSLDITDPENSNWDLFIVRYK
jgi:hypothetical protein